MIDVWTNTSRGRALDLLNPSADDVSVLEVARSLGNQCRYNGCTLRYYSVAEHSVLIARWLRAQGEPTNVVLGGLLHDCAEAYLGDITHPVQQLLWLDGPDGSRVSSFSPFGRETDLEKIGRHAVQKRFKDAQTRLESLIIDQVNECVGERVVILDDLHCPQVKEADLMILLDELNAVLTPARKTWYVEQIGLKPLGVSIVGLAPERAAEAWIYLLKMICGPLQKELR